MKTQVLLATHDSGLRARLTGEVADLCQLSVSRSVSHVLRRLERTPPDVLILDLTLPNLDGLELLHALRHAASPDMVVVAAGPLDLTGSLGILQTRQVIPVRRTARPIAAMLRALLDPHTSRTLREVRYQPGEDTFFVAFMDGKTYELPRRTIEADDGSPVLSARIAENGEGFVVRQRSGNTYGVAWDFVLHHQEPRYRYYKGRRERQRTEARRAQRIGEHVRRARKARGWSLEELATRSGMHRPNLHRLEVGRHLPSLETLERVADALGLPVANLVAA